MKYRRDAFHVLFFIGMSSIAFSVSASSTGIIHFSGKILEPSCYAGQVDPNATDKGYLVCWHEAWVRQFRGSPKPIWSHCS